MNPFLFCSRMCGRGEIGIRNRLKICRSQDHAGSSPAARTSSPETELLQPYLWWFGLRRLGRANSIFRLSIPFVFMLVQAARDGHGLFLGLLMRLRLIQTGAA